MLENPIQQMLKKQNLIISDGALGTELEKRGCDLNNKLWSAQVLVDSPEIIQDVHLDYLRAGADCITTASYQASIAGYVAFGLTEAEAKQKVGLAVKLALTVRDDFWSYSENRAGRMHPFVAASMGPYGAYLHDGSEYTGNYSVSQADLMDFHRPQLLTLIESGAEVIAFETLPALSEARALLKILQEFPTMSAWFSFSAKNGHQISNGDLFSDCVDLLSDEKQVADIGINCTAPQFVGHLIKEAVRFNKKPIIVYPNCGESYDVSDNSWHGEAQCSNFLEDAKIWYENGASIIGGCCRTNPHIIQELASHFRQAVPLAIH